MLTTEMPAARTASMRLPWYTNWLLEPLPPAAAVDLDEHGRRLGGFHQVCIQPLHIRMRRAVGHVAMDRQARVVVEWQIRPRPRTREFHLDQVLVELAEGVGRLLGPVGLRMMLDEKHPAFVLLQVRRVAGRIGLDLPGRLGVGRKALGQGILL